MLPQVSIAYILIALDATFKYNEQVLCATSFFDDRKIRPLSIAACKLSTLIRPQHSGNLP